MVGKAENGTLIASDVPALLKYTRTVYYIDNLEIARLTPDSIEFFDTRQRVRPARGFHHRVGH